MSAGGIGRGIWRRGAAARAWLALGVVLGVGCASAPPHGASDAAVGGGAPSVDPVAYVDPFIGTEVDHGQLFPGATTPFGLVKLSPDTDGGGQSGYDYASDVLHGFSHVRIGGVGCRGAGGSLLVKPGLGAPTPEGYRERMDKATEAARVGYYGVTLASGVRAEVTATPRAGVHRYAYPPSDSAYVLLDLGRAFDRVEDAAFEVVGPGEVAGTVAARNVCGTGFYRLYFSLALDVAPVDWAAWTSAGVAPRLEAARDTVLGLWLRLPPSAQPRTVRVDVGVSPVSRAQARRERLREADGQPFEALVAQSEAAWRAVLGRVEVRGGEPDATRLFYTLLYRSHLVPVNATSSDGTYRAARDEATVRRTAQTASGFTYYSGWSTWDDFRKYALLGVLHPDRLLDFARSVVDYYRTRGTYTAWARGYWPVPSVRQEFAGALVLGAYQLGLTDFDAAAAFAGMEEDFAAFPQRNVGYRLERAYHAYLVYRMAARLGHAEAAARYRAEALAYRTLWNADQPDERGIARGFFTPGGARVDDVEGVGVHAYEGSLWQYRWFVPHDVAGLAALRGGRAALAEDLATYFERDLHMALNEPAFHAPFLFNYLGRPDLTQRWARHFTTEVSTHRYHNHGRFEAPVVRPVFQPTPDGYLPTMDDDAGAMASWYVMSALGLFAGTPGDPYFLLSTPHFPEVVLHPGGGEPFVIRTRGVERGDRFIQRAWLDGAPYDRPWIPAETLRAGGMLELELGPSPSTWGRDPDLAPPSLSTLPRP